jgi:hypothetical protein
LFRLSILNQLCLQFPDYVGVFDLLMEAYTLLSLVFYFWQNREAMMLFVDKTFIYPIFNNQKSTDIKMMASHMKLVS